MTTSVTLYICIGLCLALALCVGFLFGAIQLKNDKDIIINCSLIALILLSFLIGAKYYSNTKHTQPCSVEKNYIYIQKNISEFKIDTVIDTKHINGIVSGHDTIYIIYYNKK